MAKEFEVTPQQRGLMDFLISAKRDGYASGESTTVDEEDGSHSTRFGRGEYKFHDNWVGGEPFSGIEKVNFQGKPYWAMVYFGADQTRDEGIIDAKTIETLRLALRAIAPEMPVRGPKRFENGEYIYENNWEGDIDSFSGREEIYFEGKRVYNCSYVGGLVNKIND
ncbi:MAG: DUF5680 domain-containing protein [Candidatus Levyibacteriota bacterium]